MKHLADYTEQAQTDLFRANDAFFAFSDKQVYEQLEKLPHLRMENLTNLGAGLICPKDKAPEVINGLSTIQEAGMQQDIKENGKQAIIIRELYNYESFYTGDPSDAIRKLKPYKFTEGEILEAMRLEYPNYQKHNN